MGKNRVVFIRHSERLDRRDEYSVNDWPDRDNFPWDTPICNADLPQQVGQKLLAYLLEESTSNKVNIRVIVSPFTRCIQTASHLCTELELSNFSVDKSFGEQMHAILHTTRRDYFDDINYIQSDGSIVATTSPALPHVLDNDPNGKFRFDSDYISQNLYRSYDYMVGVKDKINSQIQIVPPSLLGVDVSPNETTQNTYNRYTTSASKLFSELRNNEISEWNTLTLKEKEENTDIKEDIDTMTLVISHGDCVASIGAMCGLSIYDVQVCGFIIVDIGQGEEDYSVVHKDRVFAVEDEGATSSSGGGAFSVNLGNR